MGIINKITRISKRIFSKKEISTNSVPSSNFVQKPLPKKYITLGVDFGTHGTKVAFREVGKDISSTIIIDLENSGTENRSTAVYPSLISIKGDSLYFGCKYAQSKTIENFKMRIGENVVESESGLSYEDLTILFLSYVFRQCEAIIKKYYSKFDCKILLNLGAPFSDISDNSATKKAYERILKLAWRLWRDSDMSVVNGIAFEDAESFICQSDSISIDGEDVWRWLVPEIQAAITTYAMLNPVKGDTCYHIVIDIGGYTTDVSVFNVGQQQGQPSASIFVSEVIKEACIGYDNADDKSEFVSKLRQKICNIIRQPADKCLLKRTEFVNYDNKLLWSLGGGARNVAFIQELLEYGFLTGFKNMERKRNNELFGEMTLSHTGRTNLLADDLMSFFTIAIGLATEYKNLMAIINAEPLPIFKKPEEWGTNLYEEVG